MSVDPVRALALLWRASSDPEGAALWSQEDIHQADLLQLAGLGQVAKRRPKPHQLGFFEMNQTEHAEQWVTYFEISEDGEDVWDHLLEVVRHAATRGKDDHLFICNQ